MDSQADAALRATMNTLPASRAAAVFYLATVKVHAKA